jgi:vitamin B12 transporter
VELHEHLVPHLRGDIHVSLKEAIMLIFLLLASAQAAAVNSTSDIIVTASRIPEEQAKTPASATVIDGKRIERLGEPLLYSLLRLTPSAAVESGGPAGTFSEVRIRGAEANHTLLFIDGIRANDPAAGDAPRFELLNADLASRIEVVRGPQSALWGSDAIGGVIAVNGTEAEPDYSGSAEVGSFGFARASASAGAASDHVSITGALGWQRSNGIDSFGVPGGDKDGYHNLSARLRGGATLSPIVRLGATGFLQTGRTDFDGYDPLTGERTDTLDSSKNRLMAGRIWTDFGSGGSSWSGRVGVTLLGSSNRNFLDDDPVNRTKGSRRTIDAQVQRTFSTGAIKHKLIVAAEAESERFHARGQSAGLPTDQDRSRRHQAITGEWIAVGGKLTGDVAVRRDFFNRFEDATTLRASALANIGGGFSIAGSYAEGMAQPTFFDLYGTFPNIFVGNPSLKPETSSGFEGSLRFRRSRVEAALTAYRQRLHDEIVDVFDLSTFRASTENSKGVSHRWGIEAEFGWAVSSGLRLSANYAFLHATQPDSSTGVQLRERRRPKHSGSVRADGSSGRWSYGASIAYSGSHLDSQEVFPFGIVNVKPYWLADARVAYAVRPGVELFVRGSNLFDSDYEEVAGYRTEGIGGFVGIRLADRRSSP